MKQCTITGCSRKLHARGWCTTHYMRWRKHGNPQHVDEIHDPTRTCSKCDSKYFARDLCRKHYYREYPKRTCTVNGCERKEHSSKLCHMHYMRHYTHGEVGPATSLRAPMGSGHKDGQGYIRISRKMQHRIVMEQRLGRPLRNDERVHHINSVRDDNRDENLELWHTGHPNGGRVSDLIAYAEEILERYGHEREYHV